MRTRGTPSRAASCTSATRCRSLACTPPGPMRLTMSRTPSARPRSHAASSAGLVKNEPSSIAASIRGRSWSTGRPAPRFRWPTSELPIWPGGSPTASSDARSTLWGHVASSPRHVGMGAAAIASSGPPSPIPNPSSTTSTIGRGRVPARRAVSVTGRSAGQAAGPGRHAGSCDDPRHLVRLERRATDERSVDGRLGEERRRCSST